MLYKYVLGSSAPIYFTFKDPDTGDFTDPATPVLDIYDSNQLLIATSKSLSKESTGIWYYNFSFSTALSTAVGVYQAWCTYEYGGLPYKDSRYLRVVEQPFESTREYNFLRSIRRLIGDIDENNYRYQDYELAGFIFDATKSLSAKYYNITGNNLGYTATLDFDTITFNQDLDDKMFYMLCLMTLLLIKESEFNEQTSQVGYIKTGDMTIDVSKGSKDRFDYLKLTNEKIDKEIKMVSLQGISGARLFTFGTGINTGEWVR